MCFKGLRWSDNDEITRCGVFYGGRSFSPLVSVTTYIFLKQYGTVLTCCTLKIRVCVNINKFDMSCLLVNTFSLTADTEYLFLYYFVNWLCTLYESHNTTTLRVSRSNTICGPLVCRHGNKD